jgi:glycosyltransferase involved in cell wall biosynthesis
MKVTLVRSRAIDPNVRKFAKALSQNDFDVCVLIWDRQSTLGSEKEDGYTVYKFSLKSPYDRFIVLFSLPLWWVYEFFFLLKDDSMIIHSFDLDTLIPAVLVKMIRRVKLCYTIYDFYADNLPAFGVSPAIQKLVSSIEKFGIRFTEVLFLVDESRFEQVKGAKIKRVVYVYNSPPDSFRGKPVQEPRKTGKTTIFYAGLTHWSRGLEYMIKAVRGLDDIKLVIAGKAQDETVFKTRYVDPSPRSIQYIGQISYEQVIKKTMEADILFAFYDPRIPNSKYASPNKLFEAMMCGKPIIVSDGGTMANIVKKLNCGLVVPYGDISAIRKAIVRLKNDPRLRRELGENGRKAYEEEYSWNIMENRLIDAYRFPRTE